MSTTVNPLPARLASAAGMFIAHCEDVRYRSRPATAQRIKVSFTALVAFFAAGRQFRSGKRRLNQTEGDAVPAFLRPIVGYNNVGLLETASSSNYHSMQASVNRRFAHSVQFGVNWTWSKAMDYNDGDTDSISALVPVRVWNYGMASFDRTHAFKFNWLYDVPSLKTGMAPLKFIASDWQLYGVASFVSGAPTTVGFTTTNGIDITGTASHGPRINVTGNPVLAKDDRTFYQNFNTSVFQLPAVGTFGNSAKTLLRGPGINNWDLSLSKNFPIKERVKVQFRWETYNAFNHTQFSAFDTTARFDATGRQVNGALSQFTVAATRESCSLPCARRFSPDRSEAKRDNE
jgi:hypothetical protein